VRRCAFPRGYALVLTEGRCCQGHMYGTGEDYWEDDDWEAPKDEEDEEGGDGELESRWVLLADCVFPFKGKIHKAAA
jgi:hypothetical protein